MVFYSSLHYNTDVYCSKTTKWVWDYDKSPSKNPMAINGLSWGHQPHYRHITCSWNTSVELMLSSLHYWSSSVASWSVLGFSFFY